MAKRKRTRNNAKEVSDGYEVAPPASKLNIRSYEDMADSEDEFHINRDKILLDPSAAGSRQNRRPREDDEIVESDEEVLAYADGIDDEEISEVNESEVDASDGNDEALQDGHSTSDSVQGKNNEDEHLSGWGDSKSDYYNADVIETEQDALEEEEEARRIQQKRLKAFKEEDFAFDERDWLTSTAGEAEERDEGTFSEVLPRLQISEDMDLEERLKLLKSRYPEFQPLAQDLLDLQPLYYRMAESLGTSTEHSNHSTMGTQPAVEVLKFRALSSYFGALAMYFALMTSPAHQSEPEAMPLPPHELQKHGVMDSLVRCRETWEKLKDAVVATASDQNLDQDREVITSPLDETVQRAVLVQPLEHDKPVKASSKRHAQGNTLKSASETGRAERLLRTERSLAALSNLQHTRAGERPTQRSKNIVSTLIDDDVDSDLGDEAALTPQEAAQKAQRRKSLRFYTSQIAQKANKRANAARATGGDEDIPHRERLRDRQERLLREAQRRATKSQREDPTALNTGLDDEEQVESNMEREKKRTLTEEDDLDAAELEGRAMAKKRAKLQRDEAHRQAHAQGGTVVQYRGNEIGLDGRREIGYVIEKNKGLTPKRKKEAKNPRVKKRLRYEDKTKKLRSMKPTYKGGEGRGGYQGELTGIKTNLVRSTKL